jgi:hypothetical protein
VPGNVDAVLFGVGFLVGAGSIGALGISLLEDHPRRVILPITVLGAVCGGVLVGWALNAFVHFAGRTGP